jgi:glutamine cyclotransferase
LILSDGSNVLTYVDPQTFAAGRRLSVTWNGRPVHQLNELEFIQGKIWANIWQTDFIIQIDPTDGKVTSYLDLTGILPAHSTRGGEDVLNGIAYNPKTRRVFVSGKRWPLVFELKIKHKAKK